MLSPNFHSTMWVNFQSLISTFKKGFYFFLCNSLKMTIFYWYIPCTLKCNFFNKPSTFSCTLKFGYHWYFLPVLLSIIYWAQVNSLMFQYRSFKDRYLLSSIVILIELQEFFDFMNTFALKNTFEVFKVN